MAARCNLDSNHIDLDSIPLSCLACSCIHDAISYTLYTARDSRHDLFHSSKAMVVPRLKKRRICEIEHGKPVNASKKNR